MKRVKMVCWGCAATMRATFGRTRSIHGVCQSVSSAKSRCMSTQICREVSVSGPNRSVFLSFIKTPSGASGQCSYPSVAVSKLGSFKYVACYSALMNNGHKAAMHLRSKVSRGGRIVLPRAVRKRLDVRAGDYLHYALNARSVRLCKEIPQGAG